MDANGFFPKGFRSAMQKAGKRGRRSRPFWRVGLPVWKRFLGAEKWPGPRRRPSLTA